MKPVIVNPTLYIDFNKENIKGGSKFKVVDHVIMSKYKNAFAKGYVPNWSEEVFVIKKVTNTVPWTYIISDLQREVIFGTFSKKEIPKNKLKRI